MKYKKNFQATQNPCWHRLRGRAGLTQSSAQARKGRSGPPPAEGSFLLPFWLLGKPHAPLPALPGPPPHPWIWELGHERGEGQETSWKCCSSRSSPRPSVKASFIPQNCGVVLLWHRPHPHPARRGKPMGNTLGVPRERCPSWSGSALAPGSLSGCPQQPQHGAAAGHSPVSFSYQNSKEQGSALSPLICSAAAARLPAVPHPAEGEGTRSFWNILEGFVGGLFGVFFPSQLQNCYFSVSAAPRAPLPGVWDYLQGRWAPSPDPARPSRAAHAAQRQLGQHPLRGAPGRALPHQVLHIPRQQPHLGRALLSLLRPALQAAHVHHLRLRALHPGHPLLQGAGRHRAGF